MKATRRRFLSTLAATATISPPATMAEQKPKPRIILLAHGLFGFSKIGPTPYFNGVRMCFDPGSVFLTPQVSPTGTYIERARKLKDTIEHAIQSEVDRQKAVHVVAHSMGGLDARYLISSNGLGCAAWIASLTTISTPHNGSPIADFATGERTLKLSDLTGLAGLPQATLRSILDSIGKSSPSGSVLGAPKAIFEALRDLKGYMANVLGTPPAAIPGLTTKAMAVFSMKYPDLQGVPLLCCGGVSDPGKTMSRLFFPTWALLKAVSGDNDGLVPAASSRWKPNIPMTTVAADHLELVGLGKLLDGLPVRNHFDVCTLYSTINSWQKGLNPALRK